MNCTTLKTVVVGDSVKYIGVSAFIGCTNLETINIPASVMFVGSDAFYQCDSLKSVTIESFAELEDAGLYITEVVKRLYRSEGLKAAFPDGGERIRHILQKQVYGMAPTRIIYLIATNYILGFDEELKA